MKAEDRDPVDFLSDILDSIEKIEVLLKALILKSSPGTQKQYMQWFVLSRS